jgi:hypothetical protein
MDSSPLRAALLVMLLAAGTAPAQDAAPGRTQEVFPPDIPGGAFSPTLTYESLSPRQLRTLDEHSQVVCLPEEARRDGPILTVRVLCTGVLSFPYERARSVLGHVSGYGRWLILNPGYKKVDVSGSRLRIGVGRSGNDRIREHMTYDVTPDRAGMEPWTVRWELTRCAEGLAEGSFLAISVAPHPEFPGRTLVLHTQEVHAQGRMARSYLQKQNREGITRAWLDGRKHARRIHWALQVEGEGLHGREAERAYAEHYRREFNRLPPGYEP